MARTVAHVGPAFHGESTKLATPPKQTNPRRRENSELRARREPDGRQAAKQKAATEPAKCQSHAAASLISASQPHTVATTFQERQSRRGDRDREGSKRAPLRSPFSAELAVVSSPLRYVPHRVILIAPILLTSVVWPCSEFMVLFSFDQSSGSAMPPRLRHSHVSLSSRVLKCSLLS